MAKTQPQIPPEVLHALPSSEDVAAAASLTVWDARGNEIRFGVLFELEKTIVIFIRHFFCGMCQDYVTQLASVPPEAIERAGTKIVIVGCGDWQLIQTYRQITGFKGLVYADPTRSVYRHLGMTIENLALAPPGEKKRSYIKSGYWPNVFRSIWTGPLKNPLKLGKQGNLAQLGGEFIVGPGNTCSFASRMQHTQDHVEVADLMRIAGVAYS